MIVITGILVFWGITGFSQQKKLKDLIGRWEIVGEQNDSASLEIIDSSTIILSFMGEKKKIIDYKIDFQKAFDMMEHKAILQILKYLADLNRDLSTPPTLSSTSASPTDPGCRPSRRCPDVRRSRFDATATTR
jgi:hypothetical protein